jgi:hypothetical protein
LCTFQWWFAPFAPNSLIWAASFSPPSLQSFMRPHKPL